MASPTWFFDGDLLRIYEVPPASSYVTDGDGYRIYTPDDIPGADETLFIDIQKDLWSRWVDWAMTAKWAYLAFERSGGSFRGYDQYGQEKYQSVDFNLKTDIGWKIVLADYHHEAIFLGNLYSNSSGQLFDHDRITATPPPMPRMEGYADLLTYRSTVGSGVTQQDKDDITAGVWQELLEAGYSYEAVMKVMAAVLAGKVSGAGTGTEKFRDLADALDRVTSTVDEDGNRDSVTINVP